MNMLLSFPTHSWHQRRHRAVGPGRRVGRLTDIDDQTSGHLFSVNVKTASLIKLASLEEYAKGKTSPILSRDGGWTCSLMRYRTRLRR